MFIVENLRLTNELKLILRYIPFERISRVDFLHFLLTIFSNYVRRRKLQLDFDNQTKLQHR